MGDSTDQGIIPRALEELFTHASSSRDSVEVQVSFYELYLGGIYDLLLGPDSYDPKGARHAPISITSHSILVCPVTPRAVLQAPIGRPGGPSPHCAHSVHSDLRSRGH